MNRMLLTSYQNFAAMVLTVLALCVYSSGAHAVFNGCGEQVEISQSFRSGAFWQLCVEVDEQHALEISSVHYRAPGDTSRSVLEHAHAAQILMHYHDEAEPRAQIGNSNTGRLLTMTEENCDGNIETDANGNPTLCSQVDDSGILAKFAQIPALQSQEWTLTTALQRDSLVWAIAITFAEDGKITPSVTLSGRGKPLLAAAEESAENLAPATVLATWRLVFNLDDGDYDEVEQFDFVLDAQAENRRPMVVTSLATESFASVNRPQFRGWRIIDPTGSGYYLDPSDSGFNYVSSQYNWANFDLALSRFDTCERYALNNIDFNEEDQSTAVSVCGESLDDFVNSEALSGAHPVLWFSQSRTLNPSTEHWPAIRNLTQAFTLLPFDWTSASPFEVIQ